MQSVKPKIFVGLVDIASQIRDFQQSFNSLGYETLTAVHHTHESSIVHTEVDYDFNKIVNQKRRWYDNIRPYKLRFVLQYLFGSIIDNPKKHVYKKAIKECNIFIFIWSTFEPTYTDLAYLKSIGKTVVCIHVGDDVRWKTAMEQEFKLYDYLPIAYPQSYLNSTKKEHKLSWLRNSEKFADIIYSRADQNQLALRPHYKWRMMVIPSDFKENSIQNKENPLVIHSPSNREVKGTKYIIEAVDRLKFEGLKFRFQLIENMPHLDALKTYDKADIVIDQLLCPGAGKFATECLAMGKVVMAKMGYGVYPDYHPDIENHPIIDVCPETIYEKLKSTILDYDLRQQKAKQARPYVEKHLNFDNFCKNMLLLLEQKEEERQYEFYPSFFRNQFIPEDETEVYNQWTNYVKDCEWYKKYVSSGERDGLIF